MKLILLLLPLSLLIACSSLPPVEKGAPVAVLDTKHQRKVSSQEFFQVKLLSVDGKRAGSAPSVRLSPGKRVLKFYCQYGSGGFIGSARSGNAEVSVNLKDGGYYKLSGRVDKDRPKIYVVNIASGKIVASQEVKWVVPDPQNAQLAEDLMIQMMVPYTTGVY